MVMQFPAKKNAGCPKAPRDFPPRKDGILLRPLDCLGTLPLPPLESVRTHGQAYADVRTKISQIDCLPNFLTHGALLCGIRPQRSSTVKFSISVGEFLLSLWYTRRLSVNNPAICHILRTFDAIFSALALKSFCWEAKV